MFIKQTTTRNHKKQFSFLSELPGEIHAIRWFALSTAIAASAVVTAGASLISGKQSADAANAAARKGSQSADKATKAQLEMFYQGRDDLAPWREAGGNALRDLYGQKTYGLPDPGEKPEFKDFKELSGTGTRRETFEAAVDKWELDKKAYDDSVTYEGGLIQQGPGEFIPEDQPGYKFGYEEFIKKPYEQGAAASGQRLSGATQKDLTKYASNYASTGYDNFLGRYYDSLTPYQNVASSGQASAAGSANLAAQTGQGISQSIQAGGAAQAGGIIGQANAFNQGLAGVVGAGQNALSSYMDFKILEKIQGGGNINALTPDSYKAKGIGYGSQGAYPTY